jgi:hypothetical protein
MKIVVTHTSPDWDAIGSVWLIKKYLPGWSEATVEFVPAGQRIEGSNIQDGSDFPKASSDEDDPIEKIGEDEVVHVDTGMGPLDHHQTSDQNVSGTSRVWDFVKEEARKSGINISKEHEEAVSRIVRIIVDIDHFKEVFWAEPDADYHEFSLLGVLDGLKLLKPNEDDYYVSFGIECLEALLHQFENRIWAEKDIKENGKEYETKWGKGIGFETLNDTVIKLSQKMGYNLVVRKDPRKGYVRIKARPVSKEERDKGKEDIDLTPVYDVLKKKDPEATWYLHVSKKMLLNGTPKNPKMIPSKLTLDEVIEVIKSV